MTPPSPAKGAPKRVIAFSDRLYGFFLHAYPAAFRRVYGLRMTRVFRDSCRDTWQNCGLAGLGKLWLHTLFDLVVDACLERWHNLKEVGRAMAGYSENQTFPLRLWIALIATSLAFVVSLVASLNLYMIEDSSQFTQAAYSASPLLRFSYDCIYLTALAGGVAVCAIAGYALIRNEKLVTVGLTVLMLLVALGGFGGLIVRHFTTFLGLFGAFLVLTISSFLIGRVVTTRAAQRLVRRSAATLGACVSAVYLLLVNVVALVVHTLTLNPVSHDLYMQGQIGSTHLNFTLIAMCVAFLTLLICLVSLVRAFRLPVRQV
ncbi:MAG TPA: hypothetical protein VFN23_17355 [Ktedonobacteraceae bacterium]|nr:hypothetical protein [Ktedonobacteraceae bacterium]